MRSGNDQFPHGGISIVASSVTRFDIPKINSPADPPRGPPNELDDEGGGPGREGDKKRGNRTRVFSFRQSLSLSLCFSSRSRSSARAWPVTRTTNVREKPNGKAGSRDANFPRAIAPLHRSNLPTLEETARAKSTSPASESVSSGCNRVQKSICHPARQGGPRNPRASVRTLFLRGRSRPTATTARFLRFSSETGFNRQFYPRPGKSSRR